MMKVCVAGGVVGNDDVQQQRGFTSSPSLFDFDHESAYHCPSSYANSTNGIISRSYSNDLSQQSGINQNNNNNVIPTMVQTSMHHIAYQSNSPGEGHNSPYTPSPPGGFDYPTSPSTKPSIPPNTDYAGEFNFQIDFGDLTESAPKSAQYTYSHTLNKLFVKMNVTCPIRFKCDRLPPSGSVIRAIPVYKRPEHVTEVVTRCPNHKIPDDISYIPSGHLIRAELTNDCNVSYNVTADGRESVTVMYEAPQVGAEYSTVLYKFMCLSSCVGGINRRPLLTCFTLEKDGQVLGRRVVEVRICSCPGRDRSQEEKRRRLNAEGNGSSNSRRNYRALQGSVDIIQNISAAKRKRLSSPVSGGDGDEFILKIRGREKYEMLKKVKEALDLMEYVSPQQQEAYRNREEEDILRLSSSAAPPVANVVNKTEPHPVQASPAPRFPTTPLQPTLSSSLTVSDPMTHALTPSHSSHPLTVTPTGDSPTPCNVTSLPLSYVTSAYAHQDLSQQGSYWTTMNGVPIGCDVPDNGKPSSLRQNDVHSWLQSLERDRLSPESVGSMAAESPSYSSDINEDVAARNKLKPTDTAQQQQNECGGRFVTHVRLQQTIALNSNAPIAANNKSGNISPVPVHHHTNNYMKEEKSDAVPGVREYGIPAAYMTNSNDVNLVSSVGTVVSY